MFKISHFVILEIPLLLYQNVSRSNGHKTAKFEEISQKESQKIAKKIEDNYLKHLIF